MNSNSASRLKSFIERVEHLKDEIKALNGDVSEIYKEAKAEGWDTAAMKALVKERAAMEKSPEGYAELQSILDLYRHAIETGTLSATRARARAQDEIPARSVSSPASRAAASSGGSLPTEDAGAEVSIPLETVETPPAIPQAEECASSSGVLPSASEEDIPAFLDRRAHG